MSVLVKGMEMPKICNKCDFCTYVEKDRDVWCTSTIRIIKRGITRPEYEYQDLPRPDLCPLVEVKTPHGDLIDRNVLWDAMSKYNDNEGAKMPFGYDDTSIHIDSACFLVENALPVIEAEGNK